MITAKVAAGSGGRDEAWPALKAAAADPADTFTAAAAEAGEDDDDEEFPPALKAAAADLTGSFTAAAAEAGGDDGEEGPPARSKRQPQTPEGRLYSGRRRGRRHSTRRPGEGIRNDVVDTSHVAKCIQPRMRGGGPAWRSTAPRLC